MDRQAKLLAPRKKAQRRKDAPPIRIPKRPTPPDRIPRVVENPTLSDHLAIITRAVMQAGMSWAFIHARWDDYVAAFEGFDVEKVAAYGDMEVDRLMNAGGIIHSKSKIEGTIRNARLLLKLEREYGSIRAYQTRSRTTTPSAATPRRTSPSSAISARTTGSSAPVPQSPTSRTG